jgi:hypothetical protein
VVPPLSVSDPLPPPSDPALELGAGLVVIVHAEAITDAAAKRKRRSWLMAR